MTALREQLEAGEVRVLPVEALSAHAGGSNPVPNYRDWHLGRRLVGKRLEPPPHLRGDDADREAWLPTVLLEGRLQHQLADHGRIMPVVAVLDVVGEQADHAGAVEIFTPFMPHGSAFDVVRREGPFDAEIAVRLIRDAALGLSAVHQLGYLHRDVKTPNIFIESTPAGLRGLLGDLGIAIEMNSHGRARGFRQPTPWIGPEQFRDDESACVATDLFGLAASLVDLLSPFDGSTYDRGAAASRMERGRLALPAIDYKPPPYLPRAIRNLVSSLTKAQPDKRRPRTALEVAERLNVAVPPWHPTTVSPGMFQYDAEGTVSVQVDGRLKPQLNVWDLRARVDRGQGLRRVAQLRAPRLRHVDLAQLFDEAREAWSR